jgi:ribbon-helix-helix CopG family protein
MALKRISITLPKDVLEAADRRAAALDRSRSWVVAQAIRAYVAAPPTAVTRVHEPDAPAYAVQEVAEAWRRHLLTDLKRSPEERLRRGEALGKLARQSRPRRGARRQVVGFDSYEDFYEWKKASRAGA